MLLCAAIIAGVVSEKSPDFRAPLLILLGILSFIFWKLDVRNRDLTKHSEEALKLLEGELALPDAADGMPHRCKLFRREDSESEKRKRFPKSWYFSYTTCFWFIFALSGSVGFIGGIRGILLQVSVPVLSLSMLSCFGAVLSLFAGWVLTFKATEFQHEDDPLTNGAFTPGRVRMGWRGLGWLLLVIGTILAVLPSLSTIIK